MSSAVLRMQACRVNIFGVFAFLFLLFCGIRNIRYLSCIFSLWAKSSSLWEILFPSRVPSVDNCEIFCSLDGSKNSRKKTEIKKITLKVVEIFYLIFLWSFSKDISQLDHCKLLIYVGCQEIEVRLTKSVLGSLKTIETIFGGIWYLLLTRIILLTQYRPNSLIHNAQ